MSLALAFEVEWFDPVARLLRTLFLRYFLDDNTIELLQEKSFLLKRIFYADCQLSDLFLGNSITIFDRLLVLKRYANSGTERYFESREIHFLSFLPNSQLSGLGNLSNCAKQHNLRFVKCKSNDDGYTLVEFVSLNGNRAQGFIDDSAVFGADTRQATVDDINAAFSGRTVAFTAGPCSLCIVKPHILKSNRSGDLVNAITEAGFTIGGAFSFHFSKDIANEFLDVYREIYRPYSHMLDQMCSGALLALVLQRGEYVVEDLRLLAGPLNPEIARKLRPETLRAQFGLDLSQNAVHVTDLPEDGEMECRYVFDVVGGM